VAQQRSNYEIRKDHWLVDTDAVPYGRLTTTTPSIHTLDIKAPNVKDVGSYQNTSLN